MTNNRRMLVLRAVVEDYIRSQEPVGSSSITRDHALGVSSATVRNDMAALEDEGYLVQPHTSAGRIPTEKGYRYFVDKLATVVPLSAAQRRGIDTFLSGSVSLEDTLQRAARLLSRITGQVAVVASPSLARSALRRLEIVPLTPGVLLVVVITDTGRVAQRTLNLADCPDADGVAKLSDAVNEQCQGMSLLQAAECVGRISASPAFTGMQSLGASLAEVFGDMASQEQSSNLYMAGASTLTRSSVANVADLAPLFDALEEQVVLMKLMSSLSEVSSKAGGVSVAIGSETHTPGLMHASVVTSGYGRSSSPSKATDGDESAAAAEPVAFVGSIGPTHMDYAATMAAVRAVARYLTGFMSREESGEQV
ncbi:heat-inducible transcriptional repressor HrcA [Bifidobacterium vespertilionis]|uniref:Heat-inducible transcription repressor HrcA n=1 Tax=Bifidobacterium vespertilionis TaxID=2562524 RepID=A0A5J5E5A8_9BIFI|nr:heat-inducible transcriptional repressor HrcA [Bifidobacterium vespertilionis]KAA8822608.1 heat-inducible transcriptional repressor HrcA [Bifidobacterium vespertilionis]KAA8824107.1 heat-inducible transcriptional repressor HrcA [Bifidobacterium vespertilionis]